ncbi:ESAT-6 like protein EsxL, partial [Mycobacterium tuberculosis M1287]
MTINYQFGDVDD